MKESAALLLAVAVLQCLCVAALVEWGIRPLVAEFGHEVGFWPVFITIVLGLFVFRDTRIETKGSK
ncbi:hypothetical protein [Corynebacterium sp.]|uniref:hypothetical protein n=1 Tax=Corynebacterium sp. TaxID=1720 RepID=UPI0025BE3906|nr:hypothetical protein [Corynebacterium sp.]